MPDRRGEALRSGHPIGRSGVAAGSTVAKPVNVLATIVPQTGPRSWWGSFRQVLYIRLCSRAYWEWRLCDPPTGCPSPDIGSGRRSHGGNSRVSLGPGSCRHCRKREVGCPALSCREPASGYCERRGYGAIFGATDAQIMSYTPRAYLLQDMCFLVPHDISVMYIQGTPEFGELLDLRVKHRWAGGLKVELAEEGEGVPDYM